MLAIFPTGAILTRRVLGCADPLFRQCFDLDQTLPAFQRVLSVGALVSGTRMQLNPQKAKRAEISIFLFLTVLLWPMLAMAIVAGFGLVVWVLQMIVGPPTG